MTSLTERFPAALQAAEQLDAPAYAVADVVSTILEMTGTASQPIQNVLHGTWLGHPLHPILVAVPVGSWTMALALETADAMRLAP
ncbi:MAG: hypothetical protein ACU0DH_01760 [Paracoccus sp. (in: a-proteobacteria)]|uniref:hypothetical protein n=1 Tax=Paracoccus sp. TaxID=267 RepID=UPI004059605F